MRKKKYCMLTTVSATMNAFAMPTLKMLADNGYEITIIANMTDEFINSIPDNFKYYNIKIDRGFKLKTTLTTICTLRKIFKKEKFDAIEYAAENMSFCAAIAGKQRKVPVRIYSHWGCRYIAFEGWKRKLMKCLEANIAKNSTNIRQVSYENKNQCFEDRVYKKGMDVQVLGKGGTIGVDLSVFDMDKKDEFRKKIRSEYGIPDDAFVYGDVGHVRKDKGANELILAFQNLLKKYDNIYLMLVGDIYQDDPLEPELMRWAEEQGNVLLTGQVNDVYRYMASLDVLVHPSYREGFGMVLQEAGAYALPLITTNIPGPREFVTQDENGFLVEVKDSKDLLQKMEELYLDSDLQKVFGQRNYELVKEYFERKIMLQRILSDRNRLTQEKE